MLRFWLLSDHVDCRPGVDALLRRRHLDWPHDVDGRRRGRTECGRSGRRCPGRAHRQRYAPGVRHSKANKIRGFIGEEILQDPLLKDKYGKGAIDFDEGSGTMSITGGYLPENEIPFDFDGSRSGFDGLAIKDDKLVIIETKVKGKNSNVIRTDLNNLDSQPYYQMSEEWIQDKFEELATGATDPEQKAFLQKLDERGYIDTRITDDGSIQLLDIKFGNIDTEVVEFQDASVSENLANPDTLRATNKRNKPTIDNVEVVKIGDVFEMPTKED